MRSTKNLVLLLVIFSCSISCDPCLNANCSENFYFKILDKTTKQDLVFGPASIYERDSMILRPCADPVLISNTCGYFSFVNVYNNNLYASPDYTLDTVYLRLKSTDIDTLIIDYEYIDSRCCKVQGFGKIRGINFNGTTTLKNGNSYIFEK